MRVLNLAGPGRFEWREVPVPVPKSGEVLVRVLFSGICGSDLHAYAGRQPFFTYPRRLGHELCVQPVETASDQAFAVNPFLHCGRCQACRSELTNCCESLKVLGIHCDGGFAPYMSVPETHLYGSKCLPAEALALVEPLVIGRHAVRRSGLQAGETALIVGAGPIGLTVALFAKHAGANLVLCEARKDRRQASCNLLGLDKILMPGLGLQRQLRDVLGGGLPQVVFDATGSREAMHVSFDLVASGGRCVFVGHYPGTYAFQEPEFHRRELTLLATRNGQHEDFLAVIAAMENGKVDAMQLITHRYAFSEVPRILPVLPSLTGVVKALITIS